MIILNHTKTKMERIFNYEIMPEIKSRWSPRAFDNEKISKEDVMALIEAARYAPSCFNEQPWRFIVADNHETLTKIRGILAPSNQIWADQAPVLIIILSKKTFARNSKDNYWNMFDAGTAWGYMSLEAQRRGLITHAMGGFSKDKTREEFNISDDYNIITVVAVGKYGNKENLTEELQDREHPETRMEIEELLL